MSHHLMSVPFSRRDALRSGALFGAGAAASTLPIGAAAFAQSEDARARWPQVAAMVDRYVRQGRISGMVTAMGFGASSPDVIAAGNRSFAGASAVDADTIYRIYSMTKPVTGMATMMCVSDGLLELDQPLHEILPAFRNMQVQKQYDGAITQDNLEPAERDITIRHLLTHTAGLGYGIIQSGPIRDAYMRNGINPGRVSNLPIARDLLGGAIAPSLEVFADRLAELPLVSQPGRRWRYSISLDLMGRVIEVVSGQSFEDFLQGRIFDPVGMPDTGFRVPREKANRLAANYFLLGGMPVPLDLPNSSVYLEEPEFPFGGAGLVSTARDYDRFLQMLGNLGEIDGTRVMSEEAVRLGTSNLFPDSLVSGGGFVNDGTEYGFGAGGLAGRGEAAGLFGWFGAAGTAGLVNMDYALRMTMMTQYMPQESLPLPSEFPRNVGRDALAMLAN